MKKMRIPIHGANGIAIPVHDLKANGATRRIRMAVHRRPLPVERSHRALGHTHLVQKPPRRAFLPIIREVGIAYERARVAESQSHRFYPGVQHNSHDGWG